MKNASRTNKSRKEGGPSNLPKMSWWQSHFTVKVTGPMRCESCIIAHHNWTVVFKHRWEAKELPQGGRGGKTLDGGNPPSLPKQHACSGQQLGWGFYEGAMHLLTCSNLSGRRREQRMQVCAKGGLRVHAVPLAVRVAGPKGGRGELVGIWMGFCPSLWGKVPFQWWRWPIEKAGLRQWCLHIHIVSASLAQCADVDQLFSFWSKPFRRRLLVGRPCTILQAVGERIWAQSLTASKFPLVNGGNSFTCAKGWRG